MELEFRGKLASNLAYGLGYAYTDAKLTQDVFIPGHLATDPWVQIATNGTRLPAAPTSVLNASLDYTVTLHDGHTVVPHLDAYYQSGTFNRLAKTPTAAIPLDSYTLWNASVAYNTTNWSLVMQVRNVGNSKAISGVFTEAQFGSAPADGFAGNTSRELITTPRTIGLIAKYRF